MESIISTIEDYSKEKGLLFHGDVSICTANGITMDIVNELVLGGVIRFEWFDPVGKPHLGGREYYQFIFSYFDPSALVVVQRLSIDPYNNSFSGQCKPMVYGHVLNRFLELQPDVVYFHPNETRIDLREADEEETLNWFAYNLPEVQEDELPDNFL